ncbi:MAG: hypothetical protein ACLSUW_02910 [Akkermansia sp.]
MKERSVRTRSKRNGSRTTFPTGRIFFSNLRRSPELQATQPTWFSRKGTADNSVSWCGKILKIVHHVKISLNDGTDGRPGGTQLPVRNPVIHDEIVKHAQLLRHRDEHSHRHPGDAGLRMKLPETFHRPHGQHHVAQGPVLDDQNALRRHE